MGLLDWFLPSKPKVEKRDPRAEYEAAIGTQLEYAPDIYEADKKYRPLYTDLELANQERTLFGSEGRPGVLDMLTRAQPRLDQMARESTTYQREGDVADVRELGPQATQAFRESAGTDKITEQLRMQAEEELASDEILDPRLRREFDQAIQQGQAKLGKGYSIADLGQRAAFTATQANALRRDRQRFGQSVVGTLQATSVDPFMAILGRPGQAMAAGESAFGQARGIAGGAGPSGMFGMDNYFAGVGDYNANAVNARNIGVYNAQSGLLGGMIGAAGSMVGAYGQGRMSKGKSFFPWGG